MSNSRIYCLRELLMLSPLQSDKIKLNYIKRSLLNCKLKFT